MSLMRSLTTRRKPEVESLPPLSVGRAASQRGGRPVNRAQISPPLALVSTTNMMSFNAPNIAGTKPIQSADLASATSSSSDDSDSSALSIHSKETDPTDLSSADASPICDEPGFNHLSPYFQSANPESFLRQRALSAARSNPVPVLSLSVAASVESPTAATPTLNANALTPSTALPPNTAMLTPATALSPSTAAMYTSAVVGLAANGLSPVNAIHTPISAIRSPDSGSISSSPESPLLPKRAPSHSKRAHEALSRKRSVQRARSVSAQGRDMSRSSVDIFNSRSPAYDDSPDSIFSPALAQVQEEHSRTKYADAALDAHVIRTKGLVQITAAEYIDDIEDLVAILLDDNAPAGPDLASWF